MYSRALEIAVHTCQVLSHVRTIPDLVSDYFRMPLLLR